MTASWWFVGGLAAVLFGSLLYMIVRDLARDRARLQREVTRIESQGIRTKLPRDPLDARFDAVRSRIDALSARVDRHIDRHPRPVR